MNDLFDFRPRATAFAVMGNPVSHSRSPQIHAAFGRQLDLPLEYTTIQVEPGGFEQAVSHFFACGGGGLNVTLPHKGRAFMLCRQGDNRLRPLAMTAQAVNTLSMDKAGALVGDNTDGIGLINDLTRNCDAGIRGQRVLLIGAGGAARGVVQSLIEARPQSLTIANRTLEKAENIAAGFSADIRVEPLIHRPESPYQLIINATAASLERQLPGIDAACIGPESVVYDMMYGREPTVFMDWARAQGAVMVYDGLGMLVEQAAESFAIWHGRRPDTPPVIDLLRRS